MAKRIMALVLILAATSVAWMILSVNMSFRTQDRGSSMGDAIGGLWGTEQHQVAPAVWINWVTEQRTEMNKEERLAATKKKLETIQKEIDQQINGAIEFANKSEFPTLDKLYEDVYV